MSDQPTLFDGLEQLKECRVCKESKPRQEFYKSASSRDGLRQKCKGCSSRSLHGLSMLPGSKLRPEYRAWQKMMGRCYNSNDKAFRWYGGRGIAVCDRWRESFANFFADMGPRPSARHSIDRFPNNDGNYEPGNCRWATQQEQLRNKSTNRTLTYNGETKVLTDWAKQFGLCPTLLMWRLRVGWTMEEALRPARVKQQITHDGKTQTLDEWAEFAHLTSGALKQRLWSGMTMEDALAKPYNGGRKVGGGRKRKNG